MSLRCGPPPDFVLRGLALSVSSEGRVSPWRWGRRRTYACSMEPELDDRAAVVARLRTAGERLDARLQFSDSEVDAVTAEFDQLRRGSEPPAVRK